MPYVRPDDLRVLQLSPGWTFEYMLPGYLGAGDIESLTSPRG